MAKACMLVNNGFEVDGLTRYDIQVGCAVLVTWNDADPCVMLVIEAYDNGRPHNYKGYMSYKGIGADGRVLSFDSQQIARVLSDVQPMRLLREVEQSVLLGAVGRHAFDYNLTPNVK